MRSGRKLAEQEAEVAVVKIEKIGAMLKKYPEYLQYDMQLRLPEIYREAGVRGNLVLAAPNPLTLTPPGAHAVGASVKP